MRLFFFEGETRCEKVLGLRDRFFIREIFFISRLRVDVGLMLRCEKVN